MNDIKNNIKRILVINFGGIGDEILFLPAIACLKKAFPDSHITLCLEPRSKSIKNLTGLIDETLEINIKGRHKYFQLLKLLFNTWKSDYDFVVSSGANKLISILLFFTGIKIRVGYDTGALSRALLTKAVTLDKQKYAGEMYVDLVSWIAPYENAVPEIDAGEIQKEKNTVLIHPGVSKMSISKNIIKTFEPQRWALIIQKLLEKGKIVSLIGGPDDKECILEIIKHLSLLDPDIEKAPFRNLYGKTSNIMDLARLIKKSEVFICSDSAPMHIGVGVKTKTIAIFGPTDERKLLPDDEKYIAVKNEAPCRPCLWDKRNESCSQQTCLDIDADEIVKLV